MKLPIIKKVVVEDLSLYTQPIDRTIYPGINMVIGGNGLGKTTLVNTILFALVGNAPYERLNVRTGKIESTPLINRDYFTGRLKPEDQERAKVTLTLGIDTKEITITRALFRPRIIRIEAKDEGRNDPEVYEGDPDELEEEYRQMMEQMLDVGRFEHFVFLVAHLLVFGEDRRTLVWDTEVQNRVIRLLFLEREFDKRFDKLSHQVTRFDTTARHKSETRKDINRIIEQWLKDRSEALAGSTPTSEAEKQRVELRLAELQTTIDTIDEEIAGLKETLEIELSQLQSLIAEADQIELKKLSLVKQLEESENRFYSSVYQSVPPEYVLILETLIKQGTCQICGATGDNLKALGQKLKEEGRCIVCGSPVQYSRESEAGGDEDDLAERINKLRKRLDQLEHEQKTCIEAQAAANVEIKRIQDAITQKTRARRQLESEMVELRSKYITDTGHEPFADPQEDPWLAKQRRDVDRLTEEINALYQKRDEAREALKRLNKQLTGVLHGVNEELTPLFSHLASKFLGIDCELVVSQRTRAKKPVTFMYPRFHDKDREEMTQVSESQRFFLDQAFRMALVNWFTRSTDQPTFFVVETPEGSLDLAYERNVADMYIEFGGHGHSIIVTSNLNSSNFLGGLYDCLGDDQEKRDRTLDLLHYGRLSSVQQREEHVRAFNERYRQLGLPFI